MIDARIGLAGGLALIFALTLAQSSAAAKTPDSPAAPTSEESVDSIGAAQADDSVEAEAPKKSKKSDRAKRGAADGGKGDDSLAAQPPMWRVSDADTDIFLVGTFHILPPDLRWRSADLGRALDQSDEVWFEAEVDTPAAQEETRRILLGEGFLPAGQKLTASLSTETATKLVEVAESLSIPIAAIDRMRPWQAFLALSVQYIVSRGFDPGSGLEPGLLKEARARGRQLVFLETVSQQLGFFTGLKPAVESGLLELTLREWDGQSEDFEKLFDAWRRGDVAAIDALMNAEMREQTPEVYDVLLRSRNLAWADRLEAALAEPGKKLVAVGAAHLAGPDSLPAVLAARGLAVSRYGADAEDETGKGAEAPATLDAGVGDEPGANAELADEVKSSDPATSDESAEAPPVAADDDQIEQLLDALAPEGEID